MKWVQFSRFYAEEGADWLAYWREKGEHRPEVEFSTEANLTTHAREVGGTRRWTHNAEDVTWKEDGQ